MHGLKRPTDSPSMVTRSASPLMTVSLSLKLASCLDSPAAISLAFAEYMCSSFGWRTYDNLLACGAVASSVHRNRREYTAARSCPPTVPNQCLTRLDRWPAPNDSPAR